MRSPALVALVLVAFYARALVPAGFMPDAGRLVLCQGFTQTASGADGTQRGSDGSAPHDQWQLCSFAAAAVAMADGPAILVAASHLSLTLRISPPTQSLLARSAALLSPLPRGPPTFA